MVDRLSHYDHSSVGDECVTSPSIVENGNGISNIFEKLSEWNGNLSNVDAESMTDGNGSQVDILMKISG